MKAFSVVLVLSALAPTAYATPLVLGPTLDTFAVLGGSAVTNTGSSTIVGNLGVSPGSAVTGFPPGGVTGGTIHVNDGVAINAQSELTTAYTTAATDSPTVNLTGMDLGGLTLAPGIYHFDSSAQLTGVLTLNAMGDPNAQFIFQIGSTLTTASSSSVSIINGGSGNDAFWQVGSSATLGTTTSFEGNILALTSITLNTGANIVCGRALARNGAVTLDTNQVSISNCSSTTSVPEPGTASLLSLGFGMLLFGWRSRRQAA